MKMIQLPLPFMALPLFLIIGTVNLTGQEPPAGPPNITPTPFTGVEPFPLGEVVIPPFNATNPGSTVLADGQKVEFLVVTSLPKDAKIQWLKDQQVLTGKTGSSLIIDKISSIDAGTYQVNVSFNNTSTSSTAETFEVLPQSQIDDVFESWTNRFFSFEEQTTSEIAAKTSDPDFDGLSNLSEYFFGLNPLNSQNTPKIDIANFDASSLKVSYSRSRSRPDLMLRIEGSNSLKDWFSLSANEISIIPPIDGSIERVEMDVSWPVVPSFPRFIRLAIELQDP